MKERGHFLRVDNRQFVTAVTALSCAVTAVTALSCAVTAVTKLPFLFIWQI